MSCQENERTDRHSVRFYHHAISTGFWHLPVIMEHFNVFLCFGINNRFLHVTVMRCFFFFSWCLMTVCLVLLIGIWLVLCVMHFAAITQRVGTHYPRLVYSMPVKTRAQITLLMAELHTARTKRINSIAEKQGGKKV